MASLVLAGCERQEKCERFYEFESHYTLSPAQDSFYVGDTIWIEAEYPSVHLDLISGQEFDFDGIDPQINFYLAKIDQNPYIQNYEDFEVSTSIGELSFYSLVGVSGFRIVHRYEMETYASKFWFIPQKAGLYFSELSSKYNANVGDRDGPEIDLDSLCDDYINTYSVILNNSKGTNYEFLSNSPDSSWSGLSIEAFEGSGGYCFYVVD